MLQKRAVELCQLPLNQSKSHEVKVDRFALTQILEERKQLLKKRAELESKITDLENKVVDLEKKVENETVTV